MDAVAIDVTEDMIAALVDQFYAQVRSDDRLGPIFEAAVKDWDQHLGIMRDFWSTVLRRSERYRGCVMSPHFRLAIEAADFERWLALFASVEQATLPPEAAEQAIAVGTRVNEMLRQGMARMQAAAATA